MMICSFAISFLAWFGLFHASSKRSSYIVFSNTPRHSHITRLGSSVLFGLALLPCAAELGWERAIALWLAVVLCAGIVFVFTVQIQPKANLYLGIGSLLALPLSAAFLVLQAVV